MNKKRDAFNKIKVANYKASLKLERLNMKTIFIYDQCGQATVSFFVLEGDYRHLNNVYVNSLEDEDKQQEILNLIYNEEGTVNVEMLQNFPVEEMRQPCYVVVVGFLP